MNNIYQGNDIQGWMSPVELQFLYETAQKSSSVLEIGSWKGRSTHAILSGCKGRVVAVDHFRGSEGEDYAHAEAKAEDLPVYKEFMRNVGHFTNLTVMKVSSKEAKEVLKDQNFDMIFIDGEHTYEGVKEDIALWKDNAKVILCGHDYCPQWPSVMAAVDESLKKTGVTGSIWYKNVPDSSKIEMFTDKIRNKITFSYIKRGDGEEACMNGAPGGNCDGHPYSSELGAHLKLAYAYFATLPECFVPLFDQQTYFNSLLHRLDSDLDKVKDFYQAIREDERRKVYVGPKRLGVVAKLLKAEHVIVPDINCYGSYDKIMEELRSKITVEGWNGNDIIMFSAGMPSKAMIFDLLKRESGKNYTCLDLGSAWDPIIGQTRTEQVSRGQILELYSDWLLA